jgi:hypothetical protein
MKLDQFEERFGTLWREKYALYDPATDHWTRQREDEQGKQQCRDMLLEYAREVQRVGLSRRGKNKAQRLFDELGMDPSDLELDGNNAAARDSENGDGQKTAHGSIMYVERKTGAQAGEARIGRVTSSKTGRTLYYLGRSFRSLSGSGSKANYYCAETGEHYWISGCKRDGSDRLYGERVPVCIDDDVREEYWAAIRCKPECKKQRTA